MIRMVTVGMATIEIYESGVLVDTIENEDQMGPLQQCEGESNTHEYCVGAMVSQVDLVFVDGALTVKWSLNCTLLMVNWLPVGMVREQRISCERYNLHRRRYCL